MPAFCTRALKAVGSLRRHIVTEECQGGVGCPDINSMLGLVMAILSYAPRCRNWLVRWFLKVQLHE